MNPELLAYVAMVVQQRSGLILAADKGYLVESRLLPLARAQGAADVDALIERVRRQPDEALLAEITEAMATNESSFFRDIKPFDAFRDAILPALPQKERQLRVWSAACAGGQEPYSIAILLLEAGLEKAECEIVATDLASKVLVRAEAGIYTQFEVQRGLGIGQLVRYFDPLSDASWRAKALLRDMVRFKTLNLMQDFQSLGEFDVIFCRNVLIYFDERTKQQIVKRMMERLKPQGYFILGSTETLNDLEKPFTQLNNFRGVYRLK